MQRVEELQVANQHLLKNVHVDEAALVQENQLLAEKLTQAKTLLAGEIACLQECIAETRQANAALTQHINKAHAVAAATTQQLSQKLSQYLIQLWELTALIPAF